jgi:hypothetical protein
MWDVELFAGAVAEVTRAGMNRLFSYRTRWKKTLDLVRPWAAQGHLPHLAKLIAEGTHGPLESTLPPVTSPAWPSFVTGKNPGRHGVFDFIRPRAGKFDMVNASQIDGRMIWEYLSDAGLTCGVLNVPITYPPRQVNGYLVPGLLSPDQGKTTYPPDFLRLTKSELGPYRLTPRVQLWPATRTSSLRTCRPVETQARYALRLMRDHPRISPGALFGDGHRPARAVEASRPDRIPPHNPAQAELPATPSAISMRAARRRRRPDDGAGARCNGHRDERSRLWAAASIVNLNMLFLETGLLGAQADARVRLRAWAFKRGFTPAACGRPSSDGLAECGVACEQESAQPSGQPLSGL